MRPFQRVQLTFGNFQVIQTLKWRQCTPSLRFVLQIFKYFMLIRGEMKGWKCPNTIQSDFHFKIPKIHILLHVQWCEKEKMFAVMTKAKGQICCKILYKFQTSHVHLLKSKVAGGGVHRTLFTLRRLVEKSLFVQGGEKSRQNPHHFEGKNRKSFGGKCLNGIHANIRAKEEK